MLENLGAKLKSSRINANLTRKQVAELIDVSISVIGLYESGIRMPSVPILVKLATHYKVSIDYLLDCDIVTKDSLSTCGLSEKQINALKLTIECFQNSNLSI